MEELGVSGRCVEHSHTAVHVPASVWGAGRGSLATHGPCAGLWVGAEGGPGGVGLAGRQAAGPGWPGRRQVRERRKQATGEGLPDCSGRCGEEWPVSLRKPRLHPAQAVEAPDPSPLRRANSSCPLPSIKWVQHQTEP